MRWRYIRDSHEIYICPWMCEMEHTLKEVAEMLQLGFYGRRIFQREYGLLPSGKHRGEFLYRCQDVQRIALDMQRPVGIHYELYKWFLSGRKGKKPGYPEIRCEKKPNIQVGSKGYVYLIKYNDLHKIGRAENVKNRLASLAIVPGEFNLIHSYFCANSLTEERRLHSLYAEKRVHREWFNLTEQDVEDIKSIRGIEVDEKGESEYAELSA